jgi:hypothetical protein
MHLKQMLRATGVALAVLLSSATAARAESNIAGTVLDIETKKPVSEVIVTATSPALQGEQVVVTDAQGHYRIPRLPPGVYTLRFDKELFKVFRRAELLLRSNRTLRVNVELLADEPEILACPTVPWPAIDVKSTATGSDLGESEALPHLPANLATGRFSAVRSLDSLAGLAPGARSEAYGVSIHGASPFENTYLLDRLSTNDPVLGLNALPSSVEFIDSVEVLTGGYMPEYGRATGGIIAARTRTGSDEFHGSVFGHWTPGFLGGTPAPVFGPGSTISGQNALWSQGDFGATLGGPLLKKRLWFFAGVAPALSSVEHTRTLNARVPGQDVHVRTPIPGTSRSFFANARSLQALGKLTYLFNDAHNVSLSVITTPSRSGGAGQLTLDPLTGEVREVLNASPGSVGARVLDGNFTTAALHYAGAFLDKKWLLDTHLAWSRQTASSQPSDPELAGLTPVTYTQTRPVTYYEPVPDAERYCGATFSEQLENCAVRDYEAGGVGDIRSSSEVERYQASLQGTGLMAWDGFGQHVFKAGVDAEHLVHGQEQTRYEEMWSQRSRYTRATFGGFVQDSATFAYRVTLNAGLRYDTQLLYTEEGRLAVALRHQLSPRVGLSVDPLRNGLMKLFGHYAKYHGQLPLALMGLVESEAPAPPLVPTSSHELVAGAEYEVLRRTVLSATYTHRDLDSVLEVLSRDASDFSKAERTQDAVTVALRHTFYDDWLFQASYTWSRLYGNHLGPVRPVASRGGQELLSDFETNSEMRNRTGLLPYDRTHFIQVLADKEFRLGRELSLDLGLGYQGRSGTPINYLGAHPVLGRGETFVLPRGSSGERTPWISAIDTHLGVSYRLPGNRVVSLTLDVFNLFNNQGATRVDENYTHLAVLPLDQPVEAGTLTPSMIQKVSGGALTEDEVNPDFEQPLQYQAPRQVRLGLRYTF